MRADDMMSRTWRSPKERDQLVEQLIAERRKNRLLEDELRHRVRQEEMFLAGHPTERALLERVRELEGVISRQNELIQRKKAS